MKEQKIIKFKSLQIIVFLILMLFLPKFIFSQEEQKTDIPKLPIGKTIERKLKGGESHTYKIKLKKGSVLRIDAIEKGVNIQISVVQVKDEKSLKIANFGFGFDREILTFIAYQNNSFYIKIGSSASSSSGNYELIAKVKKEALSKDKERSKAEDFLAEGFISANEGTATGLKKAIAKWEKSLPIWKKLDEKYWEGVLGLLLGRINDLLGRKRKALMFYSQSLSIYRGIGDKNKIATTLSNIGLVYDSVGQKQKALEFYNKALPLRREVGDKSGESSTLNNMGLAYYRLGEKQKALKYFNQALLLKKFVKDKNGEANTLSNIGVVYDSLGDKQKALKIYSQALKLRREVGDKRGEANTLSNIGVVYDSLGDKQKALEFYNKALPLRREVGDKSGEASTLSNIGLIYDSLGDKQKALEFYNQALKLRREIGNKRGEAIALNNIGSVYDSLDEKQKALKFFNQALKLRREVGDKSGEASTLNNIGVVYDSLGDKQKALKFFNQALKLRRDVLDKRGEATTLDNIGSIYNSVGDRQKALKFYYQALLLYQAVGDKSGKATILSNIGSVYDVLGQKQKALEFYNQALSLKRKVGDKNAESTILSNIGLVYNFWGEKQKALSFFNQALSLNKIVGDKSGEAMTLSNIGLVYNSLNEKQKALNFYDQSLQINKSIDDKTGQAVTLNNIGSVHYSNGEKKKALNFYDQALRLNRVVGNKNGEAATLNNIGTVYDLNGEKQKALNFYSQSLSVSKTVGEKRGESQTLNNIGRVYNSIGQKQKAIDFYNQSLILKKYGGILGEAQTLENMMFAWQEPRNIRTAVFYGKLSVKKYQELRGKSQEFDVGIQKSFLSSVKSTYQHLAELLINKGEIEQAIQVLNLYQDQQFFDFNRDSKSPVRQVSQTNREKKIVEQYETTSDKIEDISFQIEELERQIDIAETTKQKKENLEKLKADFNIATSKFLAVLKNAEKEFSQKPDKKDKVLDVKDVSNIQTVLQELSTSTKQKTATLYTLIGEDTFYLFLIKPKGKVKVFKSKIKSSELNKKIIQFYALLGDSKYDPKILSKELYKIIFKSVDKELKKQKIKTLMWQLDGSLRYIPMAALWDGKKYLIEKYQNVVFTRSEMKRLTKNGSSNWTGIGFGSSQKHEVPLFPNEKKISFPALKGVKRELNAVFQFGDNDKTGVLSGEFLLDKEFDRDSFYKSLEKGRPVVHISSHFCFSPGDSSRSFLLLGDGKPLRLNELKKKEKLFEGVELLTLSACETAAVQSNADGREIDGFAELAQRLGAGSVMASLWKVRDRSTAQLMAKFYENKQKGKLNKAESLRLAQLKLLYGKDVEIPKQNISEENVRKSCGGDVSIEDIEIEDKYLKIYDYENNPRYAHPHYWSPFILYGNWK